ncbi:N-acetylglucosamine-6-sulfatase-like isoform X2 [Styela clava]
MHNVQNILRFLFVCVGTCMLYIDAKEAVLTKEPARPNIVFILTDDQDTILGGLTPMTKVKKYLQDEGTLFTNMFTTTPICCPSRTSILTGRYQHNHDTLNNSISGNCSSKLWQQAGEKATIGTYVQSLKYHTFFAGKYLNQVGNSRYYNYTLSYDGKAVKHGDDYHKDYLTDLIANRSVKFIKERSQDVHKEPFFMMISTPAPHSPWNAAPQYNSSYVNNTAPKTGSYNKRGKDQHWLMRQTNIPMKPNSTQMADDAFRKRWRTLLSVDDLVEKVVMTLDSTKILDNTYIIYSSDNGYHLGQFGLPMDKRQLYEFDIRVPLIVRGPGVAKNVTRPEPVLNIDLAPTIIDIANGSSGNFPLTMDGRSIRPLFQAKSSKNAADTWRKDFLVEYQGEGFAVSKFCPQLGFGVSQCFPDCVCEDAYNNTYSCVRTLDPGSPDKNIMYCEFVDSETFVEVYNLTSDPNQLTNIKDTCDPQLLVRMNTRLIELGFCNGASCRSSGRYSKNEPVHLTKEDIKRIKEISFHHSKKNEINLDFI